MLDTAPQTICDGMPPSAIPVAFGMGTVPVLTSTSLHYAARGSQFIKKRQTRLPGFDEKVIALYSRGLTTREIQGHLQEIYGVEVSPALISKVTDAVLVDVQAWQSRLLDAVFPQVIPFSPTPSRSGRWSTWR